MDNSEPKKKKPTADLPLEVEIAEPPHPEITSVSRGEAIANELRLREARWNATTQAMKENFEPSTNFSAAAWKSFLGVGVVSASYFASLAFTDPVNFRQGVGILGQSARQAAITVAVWAGGLWAFRRLAPAAQKKVERAFLFSCLALLFLMAALVLGLFEPHERRIWVDPVFLFSLGLELLAVVLLFRARRRLWRRIESGETVVPGSRALLYVFEGLMLYGLLAVILQAVAHIHVPAILAALMHNPKALALFSFHFSDTGFCGSSWESCELAGLAP